MTLDPLHRAAALRRVPFKARRTRLRPVSPKQRARQDMLSSLTATLIETRGPWCQACQILWRHRTGQAMEAAFPSDGCTGRASDAHHIVPRSLGGPDVASNLLLVGRVHHDWLERAENRDEAIACGLLRTTPPSHVRMIGRG